MARVRSAFTFTLTLLSLHDGLTRVVLSCLSPVVSRLKTDAMANFRHQAVACVHVTSMVIATT